MIAAFFPLLLVLPIHDGQTATDDENAGEEVDVVRFYDLSTLPMSYQPEGDALRLTLLPQVEFDQADERDAYTESDQDLGVSSVPDLIEQLYGDEFEYAGRRMRLNSDGRMIVRAPEALHARVAGILAFLDGTINAQTQIRIDVFQVSASSGGAAPSGSLISAAEAETWVAAASRTGRHESYVLNLRADRPSVLDLSRELQVVVDYDVEIAQATAIADPIVGTASVGTRIAMRGAPTADGLALAFSWKRGEVLALERKDIDLSTMVTATDKPAQYVEGFSVLQNLQVMTRSFALNTMIPRGQAIVLHSVVELQRGAASEVVIIRQVGPDLPILRSLLLNDEGAELVIADLGSLTPPALRAWGTGLWPGFVPRQLRSKLWAPASLAVMSSEWNPGVLLDILFDDVEHMSWEETGRWLVMYPDLYSFAERQAERIDEQKQVVAAFTAMQAKPELLDLSVTVYRPGHKDGTPLQARVPVRMGESCAMALGIEDSEVADYGVEVAQFASIGDPEMHRLFDGLAIWIKPSRDVHGQLVLDVRGGVHLLTGRERFDLGGGISDFVEQSSFIHLFVNEVQRLEQGPNGEWRAIFGDLSEGGSPDALRIEIVVR